jgi:predicted kinase
MKGNWKRVNKDSIREMLDFGKWSKNREHFIVKTERTIAEQALADGYDVIVDNTGFSATHENFYRDLAKKHSATFEVKFFDIPLEQCIKNDLRRSNSVGKDVIVQMYDQYLKPKPAVYVPPKDKPLTLISDMDGTLAHIVTDRDVYDGSRTHEDALDEVVGHILKTYKDLGYTIIICSGRDDDTKDVTEGWLKKHDIPYDAIFMRKAGDRRKDAIIKLEIFEEHIRNNYNVSFVLDDRKQIVRAWQSLGLKVLCCLDDIDDEF